MARKKTVKSPTRSPKPVKSKRTGKAKPARSTKTKKSAGAKRASTARKKTTKASAGKKTTTRKASTKKRKASTKSASRSRTRSSKPKASRATVKRKKVARNAPKKTVRKPAKKTASAKRTSKTVSRSKNKSAAKRKTSPRPSVQKAVRSKSNRPKSDRPLISTAKSRSKAPSVHPPATAQDPIQFVEEIKTLRTRLTPTQLESFKELLLAKRRELDDDARNLSLSSRSGGGGHAHMPIHMADVGSDNWEHEFTLGLIENENNRIRMIDEALRRIADRTYGMCAATGKKIGMPRLRAKPWAKYCIEYARAREEGRSL